MQNSIVLYKVVKTRPPTGFEIRNEQKRQGKSGTKQGNSGDSLKVTINRLWYNYIGDYRK